MFNNNGKSTKPSELEGGASHNKIANGTIINGDVETAGDIRIEGILKGTLKAKGKLVVGQSGVIEGTIYCQNATIEGKLIAKMVVEELLSLKATASFDGEVNCNKLQIEPGAVFNAHCTMGKKVGEKEPVKQK